VCLICLELFSTLECKYKSWNPLYLIFGDFNLHLEACSKDTLGKWMCYPEKSTRTTGRSLHKEPIDYVLVKAPFCIQKGKSTMVTEFSPLPLRCRDDGNDELYWFSNEVGLINDDPFSGNSDLKGIKYSNKNCKGRAILIFTFMQCIC
jgi:hypothetical protein